MNKIIKLSFALILLLFIACQHQERELPIFGGEVSENAHGSNDTSYKSIPNFSFINQDSSIVTQETFDNKIYIADFFFTTCPTICPVMKTQMLRVYKKYKGNTEVAFLSHTIDPIHDTVAVLKRYADGLEIDSRQWHLVTGNRESIYTIAQNHYMVSAKEDETAPGGAVHSGAFILIDKKKRIRGYYDGTNELEVNQLIEDIPVLLNEK